jgi:hypothetical protein
MKNVVIWVIKTQFVPHRKYITVTKIIFPSVLQLLFNAKVVPSSPIIVPLMMETIRSSEKLVLTQPHGVISQQTAFFGTYKVQTVINNRRSKTFVISSVQEQMAMEAVAF